jgi:WD40 repeat protein
MPKAVATGPWKAMKGVSCCGLQFSPDDGLLAASTFEWQAARVNIWMMRVLDGNSALAPQVPSWFCGFSPNGELFALYHDHDVEVYDLQKGSLLQSYGFDEDVLAACFDAAGNLLAALDNGEEIVVRDLQSDQDILQLPRDAPGRFFKLHGWLLIRESKEQELEIWDMSSGRMVRKVTPANIWLFRPNTDMTDQRFLACSAGGTDHQILDLATGTTMRIAQIPGNGMVVPFVNGRHSTVTTSLDGTTVAVNVCDLPAPSPSWIHQLLARISVKRTSGVMLYDVKTGEPFSYFPGAICAAFSHDGKTVAVAKSEGQIELWDFPVVQSPRLPFLLLAGAVAVLAFTALRWRSRWRNISPMAVSDQSP